MIELRKEKPVAVPHPRGGFLVLDKPAGPSSHEVAAWVKAMYNEKAGHSGTLDPFASGVLVIALGSGLKVIHALSKTDKEYIGVARFERPPGEAELSGMFREFTGKIYQTPPKESAVKKSLRTREIKSLELMEISGRKALFRAECQHGTYIRTLASDIGEAIGNKASLVELRRTRAGSFTEGQAAILQDVADAKDPWELVLPVERLPLKRIVVGNRAVNAITYGAKLAKPGVVALDEGIEKGELIMLTTAGGQLIAVAKAEKPGGEIVDSESGIVANPTRVVMERDLFPKWK